MQDQDIARHGAPQLDNDELRHTLSVDQIGAALVSAGVPRSRRQVIRYCATGMLDAVKVPGPNGAQWFVSPASLPKAIGDIKEWEAQRARQSVTGLDMSTHVSLEKPRNNDSDMAGQGTPRQAVSETENKDEGTATELATARYVTLLERENDFLRDQVHKKDSQIEDLSTRFGETQSLLGAMQRMLAPLLRQADPFTPPEKREVEQPIV